MTSLAIWSISRGPSYVSQNSLLERYGRRTPKKKLIGPFKGISKEIKGFVSIFYIKMRVLKNRCLAFSGGSGGFRELREAGRKHFHLSWYLSVPVVTSYDQ